MQAVDAADLAAARIALFSLGNLAAHQACGEALRALSLPGQLVDLQVRGCGANPNPSPDPILTLTLSLTLTLTLTAGPRQHAAQVRAPHHAEARRRAAYQ